MKKTASIFICGAVAILMIPRSAKADMFGGDLVLLGQIVEQGIQMISKAEAYIQRADQAYSNAVRFASYVRDPRGWQSALEQSQVIMQQAGYGSDAVALGRINQAIYTAQQAARQGMAIGENPTMGNVAALSSLTLQQADALNKQDELSRHLRDMAKLDQYQAQGIGELGNVSETFKGRILK